MDALGGWIDDEIKAEENKEDWKGHPFDYDDVLSARNNMKSFIQARRSVIEAAIATWRNR